MPYLERTFTFLTPNSLKIQIIAACIFAGLVCSTAFAQNDWVPRFLARYQAPQAPVPAAATPPATFSAMVQNGAVSLSTEDIVCSTHRGTAR